MAKFCHFGNFFINLCQMVEGLFSVGKKCSDFGQFFNVVNDQILKKNITHLVTPERKKFECVILAEIAYQGMETV